MIDQLEVRQLCKQIGARRVLWDITFAAATGDLLVVVGSNGAGKTTLLRILAGLSKQSSGEVLWNGSGYGIEHGAVGYVSHHSMLYDSLSVLENLRFFSRMYHRYDDKRIAFWLQRVGLWHYRFEPVSVLSCGMQQRLSLARALISEPRLVLYDEPFSGLDASGQDLLRRLLVETRPQAIQILVTHNLQLLKDCSYKAVVLSHGQIVEEGVTID